jgi:hypothetical protein
VLLLLEQHAEDKGDSLVVRVEKRRNATGAGLRDRVEGREE